MYIIQSLEQEILPLATPWIDLEGNMLSERAEKDKRCMRKLREKKHELTETEDR